MTMSIMRHARRPVKPTRKTARHHAPFGVGILAYTPYAGRMPFTADDLSWAAEMFAAHDGPSDAELDAMAMESHYQDLYQAGVTLADRCWSCFAAVEPPDSLDGGLCPACCEAVGHGIERCRSCGEVAALDRDSLCDGCAQGHDASWSGNRGY